MARKQSYVFWGLIAIMAAGTGCAHHYPKGSEIGPMITTKEVTRRMLVEFSTCLKSAGEEPSALSEVEGTVTVDEIGTTFNEIGLNNSSVESKGIINCRAEALKTKGTRVTKAMAWPATKFVYKFTGKLDPEVTGKIWLPGTRFSSEF